MARCKDCEVEMRWVTMPSGKANPVDVSTLVMGRDLKDVDRRGRCYVIEGDGGEPRGVPIKKDTPREDFANFATYLSHFATCPARDRFRK